MSATRSAARAILVGLGLLGGLISAEIGLRIYYPDGGIPAAHLEASSREQDSQVVEDPEAGYLPLRGQGEYDQNGCLANSYQDNGQTGDPVDRLPGQVQRLLFVGDSVTHRGKLIDQLRKLYGEKYFEYWNAGVESYNTRQELIWYSRYNSNIKPDHLILTFHNNDFRATPMAVRERGQFKIYLPGSNINPWLFERSYLYRWAWPRTDDQEARSRQVLESLTAFRDLLQKQGVKFSVVLLPMFKPLNQWDKGELLSRQQSQAYFQQLHLKTYDMLGVLETAIREGHQVTETPGDVNHPNDYVAQKFAEELHRQGLLDSAPGKP